MGLGRRRVSEPRDRADAEQRAASDPRVSAFVSASAGSGKTKLLTDRLLRLMLDGADPGRIQCLTFTRAAAAEMQNRLQRALGQWVTLDDGALGAALLALDVVPDEARLGRARALFAEVLDLPGGSRIGTIHAFCQSLLRRFPLEAEISPHFRLTDEGEARAGLERARERVLAEAPPASLGLLASFEKAEAFGELVGKLGSERERLGPLMRLLPAQRESAIRRALGVTAASEAALLREASVWPGEPAMRGAVEIVMGHGSDTAKDLAAGLAAWLGAGLDGRVERWDWWRRGLLTNTDTPRSIGGLLKKPVRERYPDAVEAIVAEQERVLAVLDAGKALRQAELSAALLDLAVPVLEAYTRAKRDAGLLDYADMVGHTAQLLSDPGAAWVLYKLDGGIDHLLLDEVQDTAPVQWQIAHVLTEEFFAGLGSTERPRTFFAVGDPKQSIFSFQGADPAEFERARARMGERVTAAGEEWRDVLLDVSFRSTAPVLALVDAVFADPVAGHGVVGSDALRHYANRAADGGSVELWPLPPRREQPSRAPWEIAGENQMRPSDPAALAAALARWIASELEEGVTLPSQGRPLRPGDVLVLVQRRQPFAPALVRALKAQGVPVAGMDRLELREQPAVQDLLALCDALLLPGDDLQLAAVLTSPLGGLTDQSLMELALGRTGGLWEALRLRAGECGVWAAALAFLEALLARADFATPHALLAEALGPLGGRARLLGRLGEEAAEPIDELLSAALAYAAKYPPSLQGFVHWLRGSMAEVKREAEEAGNVVRVMTVHGAKGLEARLVILPDTTSVQNGGDAITWLPDRAGLAVPIWTAPGAQACARVAEAREAGSEDGRAERNRLLYVALTRAQDRLVVCGWAPAKLAEDCWYAMVRRGFERLGAVAEPFGAIPGGWPGDVLRLASPQAAPVAPARPMTADPMEPLPGWVGAAPLWRPAPLAAEPRPPRPLAPSRPEHASYGRVPRTVSPLVERTGADPLKRGRLIHALLQYLPDLPSDTRAEAARRYASRSGFGLTPGEADRVVAETLAILTVPALAPLFGPGSRAEQPLVGVVRGAVISGVVDRLAVLPDQVLLADYKTDRDPPASARDTPVFYLAQLAAYRALLAEAFPGRPARCCLVWTRGAAVVEMPPDLLDRHAPA